MKNHRKLLNFAVIFCLSIAAVFLLVMFLLADSIQRDKDNNISQTRVVQIAEELLNARNGTLTFTLPIKWETDVAPK